MRRDFFKLNFLRLSNNWLYRKSKDLILEKYQSRNLISLRNMGILGLLGVSGLSYGALPNDCDIVDIKKPSIELQTKSNQLFYMKNTHTDNIYMVGAQPNLTIKISPKQWAILLSAANKKTDFFCIESKPGSEQRVSCVDVVQICLLRKVKVAEKFKQTRWLIKDKTLELAEEKLKIKHVLVG